MTDQAAPFDPAEPIGNEAFIEAVTHRDEPEAPLPPPSRKRRNGFIILGALLAIAAIAYLVMRVLAPPSEETDDAYVGGDVVSITTREGGTVLALHADNTQQVKRGEPLVDLDPATEDVALASAEAELGRVVRTFRSQSATVDESSAQIVSARAELKKAEDDLARRKTAAVQGAVSGEEVSHASDAVLTTRAALDLAVAQRVQAASAVEGTTVLDNPSVLAAMAAVRRAAISRAYENLRAPVAGVIANRTVQLGQRVAPGTPLMAVVPLTSLWVDANFRETQLQHLRVGQPATIKADVYGSGVTFHGKLLGLGAGSGNAFSLLPPQNASGNWIKIVQRVPVRIALDPDELRRNPLRVGLSVDVTVGTSDQSGLRVGRSQAPAGGVQDSINGGPEIEERIRQIVSQNMGHKR